ncbi:MAG TPA: class A beta-lactamase-related serine hydrolase [Flavobacteriales bacterium]|nr:class A beta-lactamase-related serine hydrolase [Flavobacteriales bacterium]
MGHRSREKTKAAKPMASAAPRGPFCDYSVKHVGGYVFTNPVLSAEPDCEAPRFASVKAEVQAVLDSAQRSGSLSSASVYACDLARSEWFAINPHERFEPGSLMKVPTLLTVLMLAESDPAWASRRYTLDFQIDYPVQSYPPAAEPLPGGNYSFSELLDFSIVKSSNRAEAILLKHAGTEAFRKLLMNLGLPDIEDRNSYPISSFEYARFFKALYNGSLLSPRNSEAALELLTRSEFQDGFRKAIPKGIAVASKFGETGNGNSKQLHEAAIVYPAGRPYLIVCMTKGQRTEDLAVLLGKVAAKVHSSMAARPNV